MPYVWVFQFIMKFSIQSFLSVESEFMEPSPHQALTTWSRILKENHLVVFYHKQEKVHWLNYSGFLHTSAFREKQNKEFARQKKKTTSKRESMSWKQQQKQPTCCLRLLGWENEIVYVDPEKAQNP